MYRIYVDKMLFPVAPATIDTTINNRNEKVDLANGREITRIKYPGLTEITMEFRLPNKPLNVAWIQYEDGFVPAQEFLDKLESLKKRDRQTGFDLTIIREFGESRPEGMATTINFKHETISVSLEDYKIKEDAEEGFDWIVECTFKLWQKWGTKTIKLKKRNGKTVKFSKGKKRKRKKRYKSTIKTKKGETLWQICKRVYGYGDTWANVAIKANKDALKKAAKKLGVKHYSGVTSDWKSKRLPAGITIHLPAVTYSPKAKPVTAKAIQKDFTGVYNSLSKSQRTVLINAYKKRHNR